MPLTKYFKIEQKLLLRPIPTGEGAQTIEHLTTYLVDARGTSCDLRLPYGKTADEQFPFNEQMPVELMGDALGLSIRVIGSFDRYLDANTIRVDIEPDLEMFQRRLYPRHDRTVGIRYTKGRGTLRSYREQWKKNVELLKKNVDLSKLGNFPCNRVNISPSGLRLQLKPPVAESDLCLLLIKLDEQTPPICALAEVVWLGQQEDTDFLVAGMQFINIRKHDQKNIANFLNQKV